MQSSTHSARILLVEDSLDVAELLKLSLEEQQFQVTVAGSVAEAMAAVKAQAFDVLLTDLRLGDGTAWELAERLGGLRGLPGIVMSGYSDQVYVKQSKAAGYSEYLVKPVENDLLMAAILRVLNAHSGAGTRGRGDAEK